MSDFFQGWRRKTGCVTLMLTCLLMGLWVKSLSVFDSVAYGSMGLASIEGVIGIASRNAMLSNWEFPEYESMEFDTLDDELGQDFKWKWRWLGFGYGSEPQQFILWTFPYWSIAIPLTFLSTWLLLSKPLKTKPTC